METAAALVEARDLCGRGEWGPWLDKTGIPERTAQRMIRMARAGIKPATVADLGAGRVDEMLGKVSGCINVKDPETGEGIIPDDWVRMGEIVDGTRTVYRWASRRAECDADTLELIRQAFPSNYASARVWLQWAADYPETDDPEERQAWSDAAPWHPGNLPPPPGRGDGRRQGWAR